MLNGNIKQLLPFQSYIIMTDIWRNNIRNFEMLATFFMSQYYYENKLDYIYYL